MILIVASIKIENGVLATVVIATAVILRAIVEPICLSRLTRNKSLKVRVCHPKGVIVKRQSTACNRGTEERGEDEQRGET